MRIGVFGGSFDPIHTGHAILANQLASGHGLDEVWLMPSPRNPLKVSSDPPADYADRLAMAGIVAEESSGVKVCDIEAEMPVPSYTYDTLCELRRRYPEHRFTLIVGSDNLDIFPQWRNADRIREEFGILVYERPGYPVPEKLPENVTAARNVPQTLVSSSLIRQRIREGKEINFLVPMAVLDYIRNQKLYL